eukprot:5709823-Prymnesium_polylepis.1
MAATRVAVTRVAVTRVACCVGNCLSSTARYKPTLNGHQTFQAPALAKNRQCRRLLFRVGWKPPGVSYCAKPS